MAGAAEHKMCRTHEKAMQLFCNDCQLEICLTCMNDHKRHDAVDIGEAMQSMQRNLHAQYEALEQRMQTHARQPNAQAGSLETSDEFQLNVGLCLSGIEFVHEQIDSQDIQLVTRFFQRAEFATGENAAARRQRAADLLLRGKAMHTRGISDRLAALDTTQTRSMAACVALQRDIERMLHAAEQQAAAPTSAGRDHPTDIDASALVEQYRTQLAVSLAMTIQPTRPAISTAAPHSRSVPAAVPAQPSIPIPEERRIRAFLLLCLFLNFNST